MSKFYEIDIRGKHFLQRVDDADVFNHSGAQDEGRILYSRDDESVYLGDTLEWKRVTSRGDVIPSGGKVLMGNYPLPTGWNIDSTNNDRIILLTNTAGEVGDTGGDWTITGILQETSHDHGGRTGTSTSNVLIGISEATYGTNATHHTHSIQNDGNHTHFHGGTWRIPQFRFCVAEFTL